MPRLEQLLHALPERLPDAAQAEGQLRDGLLQVARRLLGLWGQVADRAIARPACPRCGVPMRQRGLPETGIVTTVGDITYRRPRWRCDDCGEECYPQDAWLRFGAHGVSWPSAKVCSRLAAQIPSFDDSADTLAEGYRVHLAKETVRAIAEAAGATPLDQEDRQRQRVMDRQEPLPESTPQPAQACVFADGTTAHTEGDWHEVRGATVTTEDAAGRPLQRHSRARSLGVEEVAWTLLLLARGVGYQNAPQRAFSADGAAWLWKLQETHFGSATAILDWYHLAEHVPKAANALYGQGSPEAVAWGKRLKGELWGGRVDSALTVARQERAKARSPTKRAALHELLTYLGDNQRHMDYPRYRALGLPIGRGQVEARWKTLVGARCKQAGMRNWTYRGAEAILRLRAARQDGSFDALWSRKLDMAA